MTKRIEKMNCANHEKPAEVTLWPCQAVLGGIIVLAIVMLWPLALDIDVSYYASVGKVVSQGMSLYTDYFEGNPPGPVLVARLSYALSELFGAPFDQTHKYTILLLQSLVLFLTIAVLAPVLRQPGPTRLTISFGLGISMLMITPEIGRRDYVGAIALLPWAAALLLAWNGLHQSRFLSVLVGVTAGLAMFFKPHFALVAFCIGLFDLLRATGRPWRLKLETWVAFGVCLGSYVWFLLAYPVYLSEIAPIALDTFARLQPGPAVAVASLAEKWLMGGLVILLCSFFVIMWLEPGNLWVRPLALLSVLVGAGGAAMVIVQGFGTAYHHLPIKITVFVLLFTTAGWGLGRIQPLWVKVVAGLLVVGLTGYCLRYPLQAMTRAQVINHPMTAAMQPDTLGAPVLMISPSVFPASVVFPLIDASWAGISVVNWPIVALLKQDNRYPLKDPPAEGRRRELQDWYLGRMAERLAATPPERVGVDVTGALRWFENDGFDILRWMREDPRFDAAWRAAKLEPLGPPIEFNGRFMQIYAPAQVAR